MNFDSFLDYILDVSKVLTGALVAFVLYNTNNMRSENRKKIAEDKAKSLDNEQKLLEATDMLGKQEILTAIGQVAAGLTNLNSKVDKLGADLNAKIDANMSTTTIAIDKLGADLNAKIDANMSTTTTAIDKLGADLGLRIDRLETNLTKKIDSNTSSIDKLGFDLNVKIDRLDEKLTRVVSNQSILVTELRTLGVIRETETLKI